VSETSEEVNSALNKQGNTGQKSSLGSAFNRLWASSVASNLADGLLRTAAPIYAITLTENPVLISLLAAMALLPWLFFAIPVGTLADRINRKKLLIYSSLIRTGVIALAALAIATETMNIQILLVMVFIVGICEVSIDTTAQAMIPQMLSKDQLERGNSRLYIAETVISQFIGSPISGFLYAITFALPFFVTSGGYLLSVFLFALMPYQYATANKKIVDKSADKESFFDQVKFGIRYLVTHLQIRRLVVVTTSLGLLFSISNATVALFMVKELGLDPRYFGVVLAVQGIGGVFGGVFANRLSTKFGRGRVLATAMVGSSALVLAIGFVPNIVVFTVIGTLAGFLLTLWNILLMSTYQVLIPNHLYGRIHGTRRTLVWGLMPIGSIIGGVIATGGLRLPFIVGGVGTVLVSLFSARFIIEAANTSTAGHETMGENKA
jgi:MFS family permease